MKNNNTDNSFENAKKRSNMEDSSTGSKKAKKSIFNFL